MRAFSRLLILFLLSIGIVNSGYNQLIISNNLTPEEYVKKVLAGPGVQITNVTYRGEPSTMLGKFVTNGSFLPLDSGIILATGDTKGLVGPNMLSGYTGTLVGGGVNGDAYLSSLAGNLNTFDASVLEFDFVPVGDSIIFKYVFASEEYDEYAPPNNSSFNDVFAFVLSGVNTVLSPVNLARLPGSSLPVAVNSVNQITNANLYVNNGGASDFSDPIAPYNVDQRYIEFDAMTVRLSAVAKVICGKTYHLKIAIADVGDPVYDSGVFLEAGSLSSNDYVDITLKTSSSAVDSVAFERCDTAFIELRRPNTASGIRQALPITFSGTATRGVDFLFSSDSVVFNAGISEVKYPLYVLNDQLQEVMEYTDVTIKVTECNAIKPVKKRIWIKDYKHISGTKFFTVKCNTDSITLNLSDSLLSSPAIYIGWDNDTTGLRIKIPGNEEKIYNAYLTYGACLDSVEYDVTEHNFPFLEIGGDTVACPDTTTIVTVPSNQIYSTIEWFDGKTTLTTTVTINQNPIWVKVTDSNGCTTSDTVQITTHSVIEPEINGILQHCFLDSSALEVQQFYSTYKWSTGDRSSSIYAQEIDNPVVVTVVDKNGCVANDTVLLQQFVAQPVIISGNVNYCFKDSCLWTVQSNYENYQWSNGSTTNTSHVTVDDNPVEIIVTDGNGCKFTAGQLVNVFPVYGLDITGDTVVCPDSTNQINLSNTANFASIVWFDGDNATNKIVGASPNPVWVKGTDINGCVVTDTVFITTHEVLKPIILGDTAYCFLDSARLSVQQPFQTYAWNTGATSKFAAVTEQDNPIVVTVKDINGCVTGDTLQVGQWPYQQVVISGKVNYCFNDTCLWTVQSNYENYQWSTGPNTNSTYVTVADNPVEIIVTDSNGCQSTASQLVNVFPVYGLDITGDTVVCPDSTTQINLSNTANFTSIIWYDGDNTTNKIVGASPSPVWVKGTDINGCVVTDTVFITTHGVLKPIVLGDTAYCFLDSARLSVQQIFQTYTWNTGANSKFVAVTEQDNPIVVTVKDINGCVTGDTIQVGQWPYQQVVIVGNNSHCPYDSSRLSVQSNYKSYAWSVMDVDSIVFATVLDNPVIVHVIDSNGCGSTASRTLSVFPVKIPIISGALNYCPELPTTLSIQNEFDAILWSNGSTANQTTVTEADNPISVKATDRTCYAIASVNVSVWPVVSPILTGSANYCIGDSTLLTVSQNYSAYQWSDGNASNQTYVTISDNPVSVVTTDTNGCETMVGLTIVEDLPPTIEFGDTMFFCTYQDIQLQAQTEDAVDFLWSNGVVKAVNRLYLSDTLEEGINKLWLTVKNVCGSSSDTLLFRVGYCGCDFFVPNTFTPNGDGYNDVFKIGYECDEYGDFKFIIVNRWGQQLFSTTNPNFVWDGVYQGSLVPEGVYSWQMTYYKQENGRNLSVLRQFGMVVVLH